MNSLLRVVERRLKEFQKNCLDSLSVAEVWCSHYELVKRNPSWRHLRGCKLTYDRTHEVPKLGEYVHGYVVDGLGNPVAIRVHDMMTIQYIGHGPFPS